MKYLSSLFVLVIGSVSWIHAQTADEKAATVVFVQKLQHSDGGYTTTPTQGSAESKPSLRATSSALRTIKYFGGTAKNKEASASFVAKCFDKPSGGFSDMPGGKPDVATTAVGLMAVVELKMPIEDYRDAAVKYLAENAKSFEEIRIAAAGLEAVAQRPKQADGWLEQVAKMRNDRGCWGKDSGTARDTGSAAVVVLRLAGTLEHKADILKAIKAGQRKDGGFGKVDSDSSDLETSYRVMRAFHMLKEKPAEIGALKQLIAKCRNTDGGYGVAPGQPSTVSGSYFASIILHWLE